MNKKYFIPILGAIGAVLVVLLITFPILSMEVKNIPVGIASADTGLQTPAGEVNAGDKMVEGMLASDNTVLDFQQVETEDELRQGLADGKYYAIILAPEDFTKKSATNEGAVEVVINEGLQPMVTMQLSNMLSAISANTGLTFNTTSINSITQFGLKAMLLPMMLILMTFIVSVATTLLITTSIKDKNKNVKYLKQLTYIIVMAFAIGFTISGLSIGITGIDLNIVEPALFLALVSGMVMLLGNGAITLWGKKGLLAPVALFILGVGAMQIPFEYLNEGWQTLVASWEPFRYIGSGIREVLFQDKGVWNTASASIIIVSLVGIALALVGICRPTPTKTKTKTKTPSTK